MPSWRSECRSTLFVLASPPCPELGLDSRGRRCASGRLPGQHGLSESCMLLFGHSPLRQRRVCREQPQRKKPPQKLCVGHLGAFPRKGTATVHVAPACRVLSAWLRRGWPDGDSPNTPSLLRPWLVRGLYVPTGRTHNPSDHLVQARLCNQLLLCGAKSFSEGNRVVELACAVAMRRDVHRRRIADGRAS